MNSNYLSSKVGRILLALFFLVGIGMVSSTAVQAQWPNQDPYYRRDRDRDYRRDQDRNRDYNRNRDNRQYDPYGRNGGYGNVSQVAVNQGYQDGVYTGSNDAQRGQNYNPQRSHFYRNGHGNNGSYGGYGNNGRYGGGYQYQQAYRQGFLRGYDEGFRRYGGYNRQRNGNYNRFPFPW